MKTPVTDSSAHNADQRAYYQARRPSTMLPVANPYAKRHFDEAAQAVNLSPADRVLELGAGMGRFSIQYASLGCPLTVLELSPDLAGVCREALSSHTPAEVRVGDALKPAPDLHGRFDVVAGFFFLHHLPDLKACLQAARDCLKPGGRFVFVEPNPFNPLYYLQITFTPTMSWRSEKGIFNMRHKVIVELASQSGFTDINSTCYGALPRGLYNRMAGHGLERSPETITPRGMRPFVIFTGIAK